MAKQITWTGKVWKSNAHLITVPKLFIESGLIKKGRKYKVTIKEVCK